jgi:DNA-binding transcriptional LysR family regulator
LHTPCVFDWNDLRLFLAFARKGSTLAAAKTLGVSQSTVHRRLTELEERLGRRLLQRGVTGYRLTELGEELRPLAEQVEGAVAAFERHSASWNKELTGALRVTCPTTVADRLLKTPLIDAFHARYPGLRLEFLLSDQFLDLSKGEDDIAIRVGESRDKALVGRSLAAARWAVYASRSYVERHGRPERLEDIDRHFVVAFDGAIANYSAARWLRSIAPHAPIAARSDSWPAVISTVKSGAGLAPMPIAVGDRETELVRAIDDVPELATKYSLLTHRDLHRTARVRAFFDFGASERKAFRAVLSGPADARNKQG